MLNGMDKLVREDINIINEAYSNIRIESENMNNVYLSCPELENERLR